jgi:hypothetical protein
MSDALFSLAKSYAFPDVQLLVSGQRIEGFDDDGGVSVEFDDDDQSMVRGADGEVTVVRKAPAMGTMTVRLKETSTSNGILGGLRALQREFGATVWPCPVALFDPNTGETLTSPQGIFLNRPGIEKNAEPTVREWKIGLPNPVYVPTPDPLA